MWQDPFAAVQNIFEKTNKQDLQDWCEGAPDREEPCRGPLTAVDTGTTRVLSVLVPGAPYPEDAERRRRTRYAVLAGPEGAGFKPEDRRHLGYFLWENYTWEPPPPLYEFEFRNGQFIPTLPRKALGRNFPSLLC